jgi:catechol 2,3-dioxygenase-like lactoylglutathione lyase family enzyme
MELIQTRNDAPSMYRDFLRAGNLGLQHVAYWTEQFDEDLARLDAQGFKVAMSGEVGERGRFVYFEPAAHAGVHPGTVIELSEVAGPKGKLFRMIREASEGWDGRDPVRPFPDLNTL